MEHQSQCGPIPELSLEPLGEKCIPFPGDFLKGLDVSAGAQAAILPHDGELVWELSWKMQRMSPDNIPLNAAVLNPARSPTSPLGQFA